MGVRGDALCDSLRAAASKCDFQQESYDLELGDSLNAHVSSGGKKKKAAKAAKTIAKQTKKAEKAIAKEVKKATKKDKKDKKKLDKVGKDANIVQLILPRKCSRSLNTSHWIVTQDVLKAWKDPKSLTGSRILAVNTQESESWLKKYGYGGTATAEEAKRVKPSIQTAYKIARDIDKIKVSKAFPAYSAWTDIGKGKCDKSSFPDHCFKPSKRKSDFGWAMAKKENCDKAEKKNKPFGDAFNCWEKTPSTLAPMAEVGEKITKAFIKGQLKA